MRIAPYRQAILIGGCVVLAIAVGALLQSKQSRTIGWETGALHKLKRSASGIPAGVGHLDYRDIVKQKTAVLKDETNPVIKAQAYLGRAMAYQQLDQYQNALDDLNRFIAMKTVPRAELAQVIGGRGSVRLAMKDYAGAIADFRTADRGYQGLPIYPLNEGLTYLHWGKPHQALAIFNRLIAQRTADCDRYRAIVAHVAHTFPPSLTERMNKGASGACIQIETLERGSRSEAYRALGQCGKALVDYRAARKNDPDNMTFINGEAAANLCAHNWGAAIAGYGRYAVLSVMPSRFHRKPVWARPAKKRPPAR